MAASAATLFLVGKTSRRTYTVDIYLPDAVATNWSFNPSGLAASTSPTSFRVPEDSVIVDLATGTAPTAVGATFLINGAVANGGTVRYANQLATLANRGKLSLGVRAGDFLSALQF